MRRNVIDSRPSDEYVRRRISCPKCQVRYTTYEICVGDDAPIIAEVASSGKLRIQRNAAAAVGMIRSFIDSMRNQMGA